MDKCCFPLNRRPCPLLFDPNTAAPHNFIYIFFLRFPCIMTSPSLLIPIQSDKLRHPEVDVTTHLYFLSRAPAFLRKPLDLVWIKSLELQACSVCTAEQENGGERKKNCNDKSGLVGGCCLCPDSNKHHALKGLPT